MPLPRIPSCLCCVPLLALLIVPQAQSDRDGKSIAFVTRNLAKGSGNWFTYFKISSIKVPLKAGDALVYSVLLDPANPEAKGSIDFGFTDGSEEFRDRGLNDQFGVRAHGDGILKSAVGKWMTRKIDLSTLAGKTATDFTLCEEGDSFGRYVCFFKDISITHKDGTATKIYDGSKLQSHELVLHSGYTQYPAVVQVENALVDKDLQAAIAKADKLGVQAAKVSEIEQDLSLARKYLETHQDPELREHVQEAEDQLKKLIAGDVAENDIEDVLHSAQHALSHAHPEMEKYTGHLVGHAHIDLQWLWEWQEGMVATYDTFNQATKFMDEFPGFTFSQSSSCLYSTVKDTWPDLFRTIQSKVKAGQWEIVGGRVCEGDTNMISPESHIRQFLYGQKFFRENFGKTATVGWEPDTFGHTIQMPQILKLGGCDSYYFCRGGKKKPLFWWQGLDGTKILAFDEPASGSWYNSDLSYKQFEEMLDFEKATGGAKDSLMVYGIGNHGGGPSREYIETALGWMKDKTKPPVKFSTASQFFDALRQYDLTKIPVVDQELNPVFDGCYTSHAEVKQLNRDSEYATTSAEAIATVASLFGFQYPRESFKRNWEDIAFNHHHDTLPGSGIHAPYEKTKVMLERVLAEDKDISSRAMERLAVSLKPEEGGFSVLVFNPCGWARSGIVRHWIGGTGWEGDGVVPSRCIAIGPDGKEEQSVKELDPIGHYSEFWAKDVPAYGWKVYHLLNRKGGQQSESKSSDHKLVGNGLEVEFDEAKGVVSRVRTKGIEIRSTSGLGRPRLDTEHDDGMSAWVLGKIIKSDECKVTASSFETDKVTFSYSVPWAGRKTGETTLTQTYHIEGDQIVVDVDCDWKAVGEAGNVAPLLRIGFDTGLTSAKATYDVPFGALSRPTDGKECSALNWVDVSNSEVGVGVLNNGKSGFSCDGNVLSMSMIRSSTGPDPNPNPGRHTWRYAIVPHKGDFRTAGLARKGNEFLMPLMSATVPFDAHGPLPKAWSLLGVSNQNVVVTGLKRAEDNNDVVLHLFESTGKSSNGKLNLNVDSKEAWDVNFLEDKLGKLEMENQSLQLSLHPFQIRCFRFLIEGK